jgi:serine/threonine protein kinase
VPFHENIVQFYGITHHQILGGCLIFEFVEGGSLHYYLSKESKITLTTRLKLEIARQLLLAIETLHQKNIIHLDISPRNILVI